MRSANSAIMPPILGGVWCGAPYSSKTFRNPSIMLKHVKDMFFSFLERQCGEMLPNWKGMYVNYVNSCFTLIYIIKHGMYSMQDYTLCDNQRENKGSLRWHKFGLLIVQFSIWTLEKNLAWISLVLSLSVLNFSILNSLCALLDYTSFFGVLFYLSKQQTVTCVLLLITISCLESHV